MSDVDKLAAQLRERFLDVHFPQLHHFSQPGFNTHPPSLDRFVEYCRTREIQEENQATIERARAFLELVKSGSDPDQAVRLAWANHPLVGVPEEAEPFTIGDEYNRQIDIHGAYGGQEQGGMATPSKYPMVFLFTGESGTTHGYEDGFREDGLFLYTGEGQRGDMEFIRSNKALRDHRENGKTVHLFEATPRSGFYRYLGQAQYVDHYHSPQRDSDGNWRQAIVFELDLSGSIGAPTDTSDDDRAPTDAELRKKNLEELRRLALEVPPAGSDSEKRKRSVYKRSRAVRAYVLKRAEGSCEGCDAEAPFLSKNAMPYLEPHHTTRVADGGPDHPAHVIALCPNCHRRVHFSHDGEEYNTQLKAWLKEREN